MASEDTKRILLIRRSQRIRVPNRNGGDGMINAGGTDDAGLILILTVPIVLLSLSYYIYSLQQSYFHRMAEATPVSFQIFLEVVDSLEILYISGGGHVGEVSEDILGLLTPKERQQLQERNIVEIIECPDWRDSRLTIIWAKVRTMPLHQEAIGGVR